MYPVHSLAALRGILQETERPKIIRSEKAIKARHHIPQVH